MNYLFYKVKDCETLQKYVLYWEIKDFFNNQFLKDLFQACRVPSVDYLMLAVRNDYRGVEDFEKIYEFLETLYINGRLQLPLKGIVLIGY
jgi:hypothetical protein